MRINQNVVAFNAYRNLSATSTAQGKSLEKLSSGFRINRAADDAAGLVISEKLRSEVRGLNQAIRNAQDGVSLVQTAEGALTEVHEMLQRIRELAVQKLNTGVYEDGGDAADAVEAEIDQLVEEIGRIGDSTFFGGAQVFDGQERSFQVGAYDDDSTIEVTFDAISSALTGSSDLSAIDDEIATISELRGTLGAVQNRLEHTIANTSVTVENLQASESRVRDTDMAQEMVRFTRHQILSQAGTAMLAQANQVPQSILSLLR